MLHSEVGKLEGVKTFFSFPESRPDLRNTNQRE